MPQWKDVISQMVESNYLHGVKMKYHMLNLGETSSDCDMVELGIEKSFAVSQFLQQINFI